MTNIFAEFHGRIAAKAQALAAQYGLPEFDPQRFVVEPPRNQSHGDISTNVALALANEARAAFGKPRDFAEAIARLLRSDPDDAGRIARVEVAGAGFINITLRPEVYWEVLRACLRQGRAYGGGALRFEGPINIEYVSANPTGPMHVGHGRGAVFGDALASLLEFAGAQVTREYYVNDGGAQVDALARSAHLRYRQALGEPIGAIPEGLYPGAYLEPVGAALAERFGRSLAETPESEWLPIVRSFAIDAMMEMIRADLSALAIDHQVFFSERSLLAHGDAVAAAIADLRARGLVYEGRLPPPKGAEAEDWEDRLQTLFRSSAFGDDSDRPLIKSDGSYTYFASDIAYHRSKFERGFKTMIDVWGADHGGYVKRMQAAVAAISGGAASLDVKLCQLVRLARNGEPVKMSKRSGDFITLREVVEEVGVDAVRFMMLFRKNDAPLEFDLAKVVDQSKDNPVFYVQYAHARCRSVLRQAALAFPDLDLTPLALAEASFDLLTDEGERALAALVAHYPRQIEAAAVSHEPHRIAFFLHDLASAFHSHWNKGKDQPNLRFVNEDSRDLSRARLALTSALTQVLASGLRALGVNAPDEMR